MKFKRSRREEPKRAGRARPLQSGKEEGGPYWMVLQLIRLLGRGDSCGGGGRRRLE